MKILYSSCALCIRRNRKEQNNLSVNMVSLLKLEDTDNGHFIEQYLEIRDATICCGDVEFSFFWSLCVKLECLCG